MRALFPMAASLLIAGQAWGQNTAENPANVLPPPPWLNKAPSLSHWVITYAQNSGSQASATGESSEPDNNNPASASKIPPKIIEVTKTGKTILEKITGAAGSETQIWRKDGVILMKSSEKKDWFVGTIPPTNDPFEEADYSTADFAGFSWISTSNFAGIQVIQGKKSLVFKDKVLALSTPDLTARKDDADRAAMQAFLKDGNSKSPPVEDTNLDKYKVDVEADIDLKTLLPVSLKVGPVTRTYRYLFPPAAGLELPEDAQLALIKYKKGVATIRNISAGSP